MASNIMNYDGKLNRLIEQNWFWYYDGWCSGTKHPHMIKKATGCATPGESLTRSPHSWRRLRYKALQFEYSEGPTSLHAVQGPHHTLTLFLSLPPL